MDATFFQHPAAGASADLPFCDEVVRFKTRLADEKIGWRDFAVIPFVQVGLQCMPAHRAIDGRWPIALGLPSMRR